MKLPERPASSLGLALKNETQSVLATKGHISHFYFVAATSRPSALVFWGESGVNEKYIVGIPYNAD